jgi:hypothetical protein
MNYKQRKSVSIRVFFIMLDALLPQRPPQGNKFLDKGFLLLFVGFGGKIRKQGKR